MSISSIEELSSPPQGKTGWPWTQEKASFSETMPNGSAWPQISVVTPSFNQGQFIEETIRSVLMQGYPNIEFIIIDGASTDGSIEIIDRYEPWLAYWISEPDRGQSYAINKGIQQANGDILLWLNADDLCLPDAFRRVAQAFHSDPALTLVIGQAQIIDAEGEIIGELSSQFVSWDDLITNPQNSIRQVSTFFSRELFDELGLIDENLHIAMDTELLIRFTQFHRPLVLDYYFTAYRMHPGAKSIGQQIIGYEESDRVRAKYFPNKKLAGMYRKRSAARWLKMSRSVDSEFSKRITCMQNAVHNQPKILFTRKFASALKKLIVESWFQPVND